MLKNCTLLCSESAVEAASLSDFGRLAQAATTNVVMHSFVVLNRRCLVDALASSVA